MAAARDKVLTAAFALPPHERAELIGELVESLVPVSPEEEEGILVGLRQIDEGKTVPWGEVFKNLGSKQRKRRPRSAR